MSLVVNHNLMAANTARNLNTHYGRLATSTQRLSSGLRINGAADDAAGLAIRELMRADVAALHQGVRNANDAISLLQTADGALSIIDEKLIRMKELAEQAATGTYNSTQRLMIESEYQAMASEITRIANATDFNGIKLLNGTLSGTHDGSRLNSVGKMKIHFGTSNESAEDYYYIDIGNCTAAALGLGHSAYIEKESKQYKYFIQHPLINGGKETEVYHKEGWARFFHEDAIEPDPDNIHELYISGGGGGLPVYQDKNGDWWDHTTGTRMSSAPGDPVNAGKIIYGRDDMLLYTEHVVGKEGREFHWGKYMVTDSVYVPYASEESVTRVAISGEGIEIPDGFTISTQEAAQKALAAIDRAIISKDKIRAHLGALQNRLENTVANLNIQAENLQASESRISDVDVATEMTNFVRNQILTQSAVAMLSQANALPQMAMQLIGG